MLTWTTMLNNCLHPCMVITVLAGECDEAVLVKYLFIDETFGEVIDALAEVLVKVSGAAMDMLDSDPIILVAEIMIVSLFAVSIPYSRDVLGMRIEAVIETLTEAIIICVFGVLAGVDTNALPASTTPLVFITVSS